jgi:hypothetical protein
MAVEPVVAMTAFRSDCTSGKEMAENAEDEYF